MILFRKLAPGRLSRAIVALTRRGGNREMQTAQASPNETLDNRQAGDGGAKLSKRTTITVETERLLIVSSERRSSRVHAESE